MDVLLDARILGSERHLLMSSDGYSWMESPPAGIWHFDGTLKHDSSRCWDAALRLAGISGSMSPPERYTKAMHHVAPECSSPLWSAALPPTVYRKFFNEIIELVRAHLDIDTSYYENTWMPAGTVLRSLRPAKVDSSMIEKIIAEAAVTAPVVNSFKARAGGYAAPIIYDRFGTVTGRLTVESGPNILLLKKEFRKFLKPSFPGGSIVSLDFSSLEARILLYESGNDCSDTDLYASIASQIGGGISRSAVKATVLAELYGSSRAALSLSLGMSDKDLSNFIKKINDVINTREILKKIKKQYDDLGYITNRYGRRINVQRPQDNIFINYYAQSTGVDISLLGFSKIVTALGTDGIRPLFVLHDALILDVREDRLQDVEGIASVAVPGYEQQFPLKFEYVSKG